MTSLHIPQSALRTPQSALPIPHSTIELLDAPPPVMRRPLALIDGHAYAATWLYTRTTTTHRRDKDGALVTCDPPLVETGLRLHVLRDDGTLFGPAGDHPLPALGLDVILPEMPPAPGQPTASKPTAPVRDPLPPTSSTASLASSPASWTLTAPSPTSALWPNSSPALS